MPRENIALISKSRIKSKVYEKPQEEEKKRKDN